MVQAYAVRQCERKLKVMQVDADGIAILGWLEHLHSVGGLTRLPKTTDRSTWIDKIPAGTVLDGARTSVTGVLQNPPLLRTYCCIRPPSCQLYLVLIIAVSRYRLSSRIREWSWENSHSTSLESRLLHDSNSQPKTLLSRVSRAL